MFAFLLTKVDDSTEEVVVLKNVNEDTSGVYKCEVMGEGPAFRTAVDTMEMRVVGKFPKTERFSLPMVNEGLASFLALLHLAFCHFWHRNIAKVAQMMHWKINALNGHNYFC